MQVTFTKDHASYTAGQCCDIEAGYAARLIESGVAVAGTAPEPAGNVEPDRVHAEPEVETAVSRPRTPRKRSR